MLNTNSGPLNFIRFGLQRKKEFLRDVKDSFDGLVIPANILLYQYKKTPLLVYMCRGKPYFIDPMTYLFGQPYEDFKRKIEGAEEFKPSFKRLMESHGLDVKQFLRLDYLELLRFIDSEKPGLNKFIKSVLELQRDVLVANLRKYTEGLLEDEDLPEEEFRPAFLLLPYFQYARDDLTTDVNFKILEASSRSRVDTPIFAMILLARETLGHGFLDSLLERILAYNVAGYCLWIDNFREAEAQKTEVRTVIRIVRRLSRAKSKPVIMMYGGYFSLLLWHFGLTGISHGTLFSQSRGIWDSVRKTSGPAPIRYYIRELHEFFTLENAIEILRKDEKLLCDCKVCRRIVRGRPDNVAAFQDEEALAEMHFLWNRMQEKREIQEGTASEFAEVLRGAYSRYRTTVGQLTKRYRTPWSGEEERQLVDISYLNSWATAIEEEEG